MILADTRADADTSEAKAGREKMQAAVREKGAPAAADIMLPKLLGASGSGVNPQSIAVREIILKNEAQGIVDAIEALKTRPDSTPTLKQIACPALVIVGDQDEVTPIPLSEVMAREIPQATLTVIPGAAHWRTCSSRMRSIGRSGRSSAVRPLSAAAGAVVGSCA